MRDSIDELTNLHDKDWMLEQIGKYVKDKSVCVAILDLDFFTNINQKIGYENGDVILKVIAASFPQREDMIAGRYGSDEFIFLFVDWREEAVAAYLKDYKSMFRKMNFYTDPFYGRIRITFSMGVAHSNKNIRNVQVLLKAAEISLLQAKKNGRNRIDFSKGAVPFILNGEGNCVTVIGNRMKGASKNGEYAFDSSLAEPYGVEIDSNGDLIYVDRSNHQIKRIHDQRVYTVAGIGVAGYGKDNIAATCSMLCKPSGVCVHKSGRVYIADTGNHCIRRIEKNIITTIAGDGAAGYSGDKGPAIHARLNRPGGVAVDDDENIYTNDYGNNVIRVIRNTGQIETIAGNGEYGFAGDGAPAILAKLDKPYGLCVDLAGKNLFIADYGNHRIRRVDLVTGIITTFCGTGQPGYCGDGGRCSEASLNGVFWVYLYEKLLYIADSYNHCIRCVDLSTELINTVVGNAEAGYVDHQSDLSKVRLNIPAGMTISDGNLYIADYGNNAIRKVRLLAFGDYE